MAFSRPTKSLRQRGLNECRRGLKGQYSFTANAQKQSELSEFNSQEKTENINRMTSKWNVEIRDSTEIPNESQVNESSKQSASQTERPKWSHQAVGSIGKKFHRKTVW